MEVLCLHPSNLSGFTTTQKKERCNNILGHPSKIPAFRLKHQTQNVKRCTRAQAVEEEEYELKQVKDMAAARKRWDAMLRDGKLKVFSPKEAGYAIQLSKKELLDVRPSTERQKAWVKGSTWIPIFDVDDKMDAGALSKKVSNFSMGGWWSGVPTLSYDIQFVSKVREKFPQESDLIVACQKGLRSLAACEALYNAGYRNLFWVQGGLEAAEEEDLEREGPQPFKFAGIGGLSAFLGWTDQQRAAAAKEGWGYRFIFSARLASPLSPYFYVRLDLLLLLMPCSLELNKLVTIYRN